MIFTVMLHHNLEGNYYACVTFMERRERAVSTFSPQVLQLLCSNIFPARLAKHKYNSPWCVLTMTFIDSS